jgi:hypothetical protein
MGSKYIDKFFSLRCAPDVLATVGTVAQMEKELTEAMGVLRQIQKIVVRDKRSYVLLDFCAGNALVSVLAVHLFSNVRALAIDKLPRVRAWHRADRFYYINRDIFSDMKDLEPFISKADAVIVVGCHACGELATRIVEMYKRHGDYLVLLPCCRGKVAKMPALLRDRLNSYDQWAYTLYRQAVQVSTSCDMVEDRYILSPKNIIVTACKR